MADVVDPVIVQSCGANGKNGRFKLRGPLAPRLRKCRVVFSRKSQLLSKQLSCVMERPFINSKHIHLAAASMNDMFIFNLRPLSMASY